MLDIQAGPCAADTDFPFPFSSCPPLMFVCILWILWYQNSWKGPLAYACLNWRCQGSNRRPSAYKAFTLPLRYRHTLGNPNAMQIHFRPRFCLLNVDSKLPVVLLILHRPYDVLLQITAFSHFPLPPSGFSHYRDTPKRRGLTGPNKYFSIPVISLPSPTFTFLAMI